MNSTDRAKARSIAKKHLERCLTNSPSEIFIITFHARKKSLEKLQAVMNEESEASTSTECEEMTDEQDVNVAASQKTSVAGMFENLSGSMRISLPEQCGYIFSAATNYGHYRSIVSDYTFCSLKPNKDKFPNTKKEEVARQRFPPFAVVLSLNGHSLDYLRDVRNSLNQ